MIFYQNYIYLFNKDSLETNALHTELDINDVNFSPFVSDRNVFRDDGDSTFAL